MRRTIVLMMVMGLFLSASTSANGTGPTTSIAKGWTTLGSKKVNWRLDRDVIRVGAQDGTFTRLRIKVTGGSVNMRSMVVTYGNGTKERIPLKYNFRRGATSRTIDLNGGRRVIKQITFVYDRDRITRKARVWVAGK